VQFEFSPEALVRLDALKAVIQAATRAEVVRNSVRVYDWLVNQALAGNEIIVKDKDGNTIAQFKAGLLLGIPELERVPVPSA
jgi:aminopeptidase-like protein